MPENSPQSVSRRQAKPLWTVFKILVAVLAVGYVVSRTSLDELIALTRLVSIPLVVASTLAYLATFWLSARRFWILLARRISFREVLGLTVLQKVVANFTASSAGVATYVAGLKSEHDIKIRVGVSTFIIAKGGDLLVSGTSLVLSMLVVWSEVSDLKWILFGVVAMVATALLTIGMTIASRTHVVNLFSLVARRLRLDRFPIVSKSLDSISKLAKSDPSQIGPILFPAVGYSFLYFAAVVGAGYLGIRAFGVPIGFWPVVFMSSLSHLIAVVPVYVFGGLGVYDVTVLYMYSLFGFEGSFIASVIIGTRILSYMYHLVAMLYLPAIRRLSRAENPLD